MPRISKSGRDLDLAKTLQELYKTSESGKEPILGGMLLFFEKEVEPLRAYTDIDISQEKDGPKKDFIEGEWKRFDRYPAPVNVRIGYSPKEEIIPELQLMVGEQMPSNDPIFHPDALIIEYSERYGAQLRYAQARDNEETLLFLELSNKFIKALEEYQKIFESDEKLKKLFIE